ncbi:MAG: DUF72 domain-containing protein [Nitrososphaerota archaeon]|nr:DUF72 domain-containing protein [Aigarchaeota archaeon]MDW8077057.1 DUF72 domain-containing protein [Nitrososphaerota archaeon]
MYERFLGEQLYPRYTLLVLMAIIKVGTSGYAYHWNEGKPTPFEWYISQGFKTVEINASFYRFPSKSWTAAWLKAPMNFDFSIKVHGSITHRSRLGEAAVRLWPKFVKPLEEILDKIAFFLFQMPPSFVASKANLERLSQFFKRVEVPRIAVIEFRHESWWSKIKEVESFGLVFCSVDSPELPRDVLVTNDVVYLRLHGRETWYAYVYDESELVEIASKVKELNALRKYVYLNNDHGMLPNGKLLMKLLGC